MFMNILTLVARVLCVQVSVVGTGRVQTRFRRPEIYGEFKIRVD